MFWFIKRIIFLIRLSKLSNSNLKIKYLKNFWWLKTIFSKNFELEIQKDGIYYLVKLADTPNKRKTYFFDNPKTLLLTTYSILGIGKNRLNFKEYIDVSSLQSESRYNKIVLFIGKYLSICYKNTESDVAYIQEIQIAQKIFNYTIHNQKSFFEFLRSC